MFEIGEREERLTIRVKAKPKSSRNKILGVRGESLHVSVTAVPEKGKANQAIIALLAKVLRLPKSNIEILSGETQSQKLIGLSGISREDLIERLELSWEDLSR